MTAEGLYDQIKAKRSFLCVGLDTDISKIPGFLRNSTSPLFAFNKAIVDTTHDLAIAYKPNLAFYESQGAAGWTALQETVSYIRKNYPDIFLIADAKRGDIGNTAAKYAHTFFRQMDFDAITLSAYMGRDSIMPFLEYAGRWVILLGLTSNPGAEDFQFLETGKNKLFGEVILRGASWGNPDNMMFVAGATQAEHLAEIRSLVPDHFLLVPGIGAQGGSLEAVVEHGMNKQCGLIVNASRSILYAGSTKSFADSARREAEILRDKMSALLP